MLDVTVTYPSGFNNIDKNKSDVTQGVAAKATATIKNLSIQKLLKEINTPLFQSFLSLMDYGGKIEKSYSTFHTYIEAAHARMGGSLSISSNYWIKRFSVILQKCNARNYIDHINDIKKKASYILRHDESQWDVVLDDSVFGFCP